jgi:hypothetical protein
MMVVRAGGLAPAGEKVPAPAPAAFADSMSSDRVVSAASPPSRRVSRQRLVSECVHKITQLVLGSRVFLDGGHGRVRSRTFNFDVEEASMLRPLLQEFLWTSPTGDISSPLHIDISVTRAGGQQCAASRSAQH